PRIRVATPVSSHKAVRIDFGPDENAWGADPRTGAGPASSIRTDGTWAWTRCRSHSPRIPCRSYAATRSTARRRTSSTCRTWWSRGGVKGRRRGAVTEIEPATPGAGARSFTKKGGAVPEVASSSTRVVESDSVVNIDDRSSRRSRALACLFVQPLEGVRLATTLVVGCGESALG